MKFIYVACVVTRSTERSREAYSLVTGLHDKLTGQASPDVVPDIGPGDLSFKHFFVYAANEEEAYLKGGAAAHDWLTSQKDVVAFNDYVVDYPEWDEV